MSAADIHSHIGTLQDLLKEVRREKNLTQAEIASVLEQSQSFVSKYESGERVLNILEIRFICKRLGLSLNEFCFRLEEKIKTKEMHL